MYSILEMKNKYNQYLGGKLKVEKQISTTKKEYDIETLKYKDALVTQTLIHTAARNTQNKLKFSIEKIVTAAIKSVFGEDSYNFTVEFETKNNRTHAILLFVDSSGERFDGEDDLGGSVNDISSFACRVSLWTLAGKDRTTPIFLLDESLKHLSESFRDLGSDLLKSFCDDIGMQIIISTHLTELIGEANNSILIEKQGEWSKAYAKQNTKN